MAPWVSSTQLWAVFAGIALSFACSGSDDDASPLDEEPGPSSGSTCPAEQTLTYENFGMSFFERYCTRCHSSELSGADRRGAPATYDWDELETVREHADLIDKMAAAGPTATNTTMPPNEPRPSVEERKQLGEWLECGAP